jgi:hypothetical protein
MTTTKKVIIVAVTVAVLGGLGYWAYKHYDKKSLQDGSNPNDTKPVDSPPVPTDSTINTTTGTVPDSGVNTGVVPPSGMGRDIRNNPTPTTTTLSNADLNFIVRVFQNWMDKNHPNWVRMANGTMGNLNGKSTLGYGNFGRQTKAALKKYKTDFSNYLMTISLFGNKPNRDAIRQFFNYTNQFGI